MAPNYDHHRLNERAREMCSRSRDAVAPTSEDDWPFELYDCGTETVTTDSLGSASTTVAWSEMHDPTWVFDPPTFETKTHAALADADLEGDVWVSEDDETGATLVVMNAPPNTELELYWAVEHHAINPMSIRRGGGGRRTR